MLQITIWIHGGVFFHFRINVLSLLDCSTLIALCFGGSMRSVCFLFDICTYFKTFCSCWFYISNIYRVDCKLHCKSCKISPERPAVVTHVLNWLLSDCQSVNVHSQFLSLYIIDEGIILLVNIIQFQVKIYRTLWMTNPSFGDLQWQNLNWFTPRRSGSNFKG